MWLAELALWTEKKKKKNPTLNLVRKGKLLSVNSLSCMDVDPAGFLCLGAKDFTPGPYPGSQFLPPTPVPLSSFEGEG